MNGPTKDEWVDRFTRCRAGRAALAALGDLIRGAPDVPPDESWDAALLRVQVLDACWSAAQYRDLIALDPNEAERKAYLQGRASFDDVYRAADTILDFLGIYPDAARIIRDGCQKEVVPESLRDDDPSIVLSELLMGLQTGISDCGEPKHSLEPHHYTLGALRFTKPITLATRKADPVFSSLAFEIEGRLRAFSRGERFGAGSIMPPEDDDHRAHYAITALFLHATLGFEVTEKALTDRLDAFLRHHPGATWVGWPLPVLKHVPAKTSEIRTRRRSIR